MEKQEMIEELQTYVNMYSKKMEEFAQTFLKDPSHALGWSNDTFRDAAALTIHKEVVGWLSKEDATLDQIIDEMENRVIRGATFPSFSTSPASNLMEIYKTSARAEMLDKLESFKRRA